MQSLNRVISTVYMLISLNKRWVFFFQNNYRLVINKNLYAFVLTRVLSLKFSLTTHKYKNLLPRILPHKQKDSRKQCKITIKLLLADKFTTTTHTSPLMTSLFFPLNPPLVIIIRPNPLWNKPPSQYHNHNLLYSQTWSILK